MRRGALLTAALFVTGCAARPPAVDLASEEAVLRRLSQDFAAAEASNNVDSAMTFIWEDATMQPPNAPALEGHAAIRATYATVTFVSLTTGSTKVVVSGAGDLAAVWGPMTIVLQGPDGPITLDQKFVAVWQKRDGKWKVIENSWSSSAPAGPGG
jgi:ketosteroid isomerase-like protein